MKLNGVVPYICKNVKCCYKNECKWASSTVGSILLDTGIKRGCRNYYSRKKEKLDEKYWSNNEDSRR